MVNRNLGTWELGYLGTWNIGVAMATPSYPSNALPERRIAWSHAILALQPYYQYAYRALIRGGTTEEQLL